MAIDKLKVMYGGRSAVHGGNIPQSADYALSNEELWDIVEACQDEGLIKGATHAGPILFLDTTKLTVKGLEYLHEHSAVMKTYKGLKELRDWLPF